MNQNRLFYNLSRWIVTLFTILMVVTAALASNGIWKKGDLEWLIPGHMHLGNMLFVMAVAQMAICYFLFTKKQLGGWVMLASALVFVFTFGQIGLGYSTRSHYVDLVPWHITLGVALTGAAAMLTMLLWMPTNRSNEGNSAG